MRQQVIPLFFFATNDNAAPYSLAFGAYKNLWFTENKANKIAKLSPDGMIIEYSIPTLDCGVTLIAAAEKRLYFTEYTANKIGFIDYDGTVSEFQLAENCAPYGIAVDDEQAVWFTCMVSNQIGRMAGVNATLKRGQKQAS